LFVDDLVFVDETRQATACEAQSINAGGNCPVLLNRRNLDSFVGDLEERYALILKAHGRRAATVWFWREVIHSFLSLAFDALHRISGLEKLFRRIGS